MGFDVLLREKKLLLFPLLAAGLTFFVALFFVAPIMFYPSGHSYFSAAHWSVIGACISHAFLPTSHSISLDHGISMGRGTVFAGGGYFIFRHWWVTLFFAVTYFTSMFIATFCNVAFYHEIMQALNGNAVSIRRG